MEACPCPPNAAIPDIPDTLCPDNLFQIVRLILTRQGNQIAATEAAAKLLATYTPLFAAADDTKIQITNKLMESTTIPPGEPIKDGGDDNSTPLGRALLTGRATIPFEGFLRNIDSAQVAALRAFGCEDLDVAFVTSNGQIYFNKNVDNTLRGFPIHAFFVGDKGAEGLNTHDKAKITFGLDPGWRDNGILVTPSFDPRFDLQNNP